MVNAVKAKVPKKKAPVAVVPAAAVPPIVPVAVGRVPPVVVVPVAAVPPIVPAPPIVPVAVVPPVAPVPVPQVAVVPVVAVSPGAALPVVELVPAGMEALQKELGDARAKIRALERRKKRSRREGSSSASSDVVPEKKWVCRRTRRLWADMFGEEEGLVLREGSNLVVVEEAFLQFLVRPEDSLVGPWLPLAVRVATLRSSIITKEAVAEIGRGARDGRVVVPVAISFVLLELLALFCVLRAAGFNVVPLGTLLTVAQAPVRTLQQTKLTELVSLGTSSFVSGVLKGAGTDTCESFCNPEQWKKVGGEVPLPSSPFPFPHAGAGNTLVTAAGPTLVGFRGRGRGGRGAGRGGCFNCGEWGHFARECPRRPSGLSSAPSVGSSK